MISPTVTPAAGITRYQHDYTQGPACAISCGAGTTHRNYFVEVAGRQGQVHGAQLDCLQKLGAYFNNKRLALWTMQNGYALVTSEGLKMIDAHLAGLSAGTWEELKGLLEVGVQWNTQVTVMEEGHLLSQIYCSALPVAYSHVEAERWKRFATFILEATYEATLLTGLRNYRMTGNRLVYLTLVGGGAFGNLDEWIYEAIVKVLRRYSHCGLRLKFVSYGASNPVVQKVLRQYATDIC